MTIPTFPTNLPGLMFGTIKSPEFDTRTLKATSGKGAWSPKRLIPIWNFELSYEFLRDNVNNEYQQLIGFILSCLGQANPFYYTDPYDNNVVGQAVGVGDGVTTTFRLIRTFGGFVDLIYYCPLMSAVYINGTLQTSGYALSASGAYGNDSITFATAPTSGQVVTADFNFDFVCHFTDDKQDFSQLWTDFYDLKKLDFASVI